MEFARDIAEEAYRNCDTLETLADVARDMQVPYTTLWHSFYRNRRWTVENWLIMLNRLGAARIEGDEIIIKTSISRRIKTNFV